MPFDCGVPGTREGLDSNRRRLISAARNFNQQHFYLVATENRLRSIRAHALGSPPFERRLKRALDAVPEDRNLIDSRTAIKREARWLIFLAFAALILKSRRRGLILESIAERLRLICLLETWNPRPVIRSFLDRAETGIAVALVYDWLHADLAEPLRLAIEEALVRHILAPALEAYRDPSEEWPRRKDNLTVVSNAGILISALALLPRYRELCLYVLEHAFASVWQSFDAFAPDGTWPEGPSYWSLSARHACLSVAALESSLGSSFGLVSRPGFAETGDFILHATGPFGAAFDFGDSTHEVDTAPLAWFAHRFRRPADGWLAADYDGWHLPFTLLWGDRPAADPETTGSPTAKVFHGSGLACFRSTWSRSPEDQAVFLAIKGGNTPAFSSVDGKPPEVPVHAQADAGSFVIDGARTRWVVDLGPDNYDLPGYFEHGTDEGPGRRWRYYRNSTAGHNTLVVNGENQRLDTPVPILGSHLGEDCKWIVFDLSPAYGHASGTMRRGAALIGRHVIIQDEIAGSIPGPVEWAIHTAADPVAIGSQIAHFRSGEDRFRVQILHPASATPRLSEPPPAQSFAPEATAGFHGSGVQLDGRIAERDRRRFLSEKDNRGRPIRRLEIAWPKDAWRLTVLLSPDFDGQPVAIRTAPLDQWLTGRPLAPIGPELRVRKPQERHRLKGSQPSCAGLATGPPPLGERTQHRIPNTRLQGKHQ